MLRWRRVEVQVPSWQLLEKCVRLCRSLKWEIWCDVHHYTVSWDQQRCKLSQMQMSPRCLLNLMTNTIALLSIPTSYLIFYRWSSSLSHTHTHRHLVWLGMHQPWKSFIGIKFNANDFCHINFFSLVLFVWSHSHIVKRHWNELGREMSKENETETVMYEKGNGACEEKKSVEPNIGMS